MLRRVYTVRVAGFTLLAGGLEVVGRGFQDLKKGSKEEKPDRKRPLLRAIPYGSEPSALSAPFEALKVLSRLFTP